MQVWAPLAFQLKVTGSPEFTLLALNCKEIEGFAMAGAAVVSVAAALATPLPLCVRESPSQAANEEMTAHAKSQREALAMIRRARGAWSQREFERVRTAATRMNRWLRPAEFIPISWLFSKFDATSPGEGHCHNDAATGITWEERIVMPIASAANLSPIRHMISNGDRCDAAGRFGA
jgi:hypothetical protein